MKRFRKSLFAATLLGCSLGAAAGGNHAHGHAKAAPAKKEQKDWGIAADPKAARRTVRITMSDTMRFSPERIQVKPGETIRFVIHNSGKMMHEMVMGTRKDLQEHAALMKKFPGMEHDEHYMAHVAPGETETMVWTFNRGGTFDFACLIPGHFEAGMAGTIRVGQPVGDSAASAKPAANGNSPRL